MKVAAVTIVSVTASCGGLDARPKRRMPIVASEAPPKYAADVRAKYGPAGGTQYGLQGAIAPISQNAATDAVRPTARVRIALRRGTLSIRVDRISTDGGNPLVAPEG